MSLADELLADLDAEDDSEYIDELDNKIEIDEIEDVGEDIKSDKDRVTQVAKLWGSPQLNDIIIQIDKKLEQQEADYLNQKNEGLIENHNDYNLIVEANNLAIEIENEINVIHKFVRDIYTKRFPELESLIPTPLEYVFTVKELGNDLEKSKSSSELHKFLTHATIMVVSVTSTTTQGSVLDENEYAKVVEACDMAINLNDAKLKILHFVESRMMFIAPNLTWILGPTCAAKLMGAAGGLTKLSKIPSANYMVIGAQRKILSGFSSTSLNPHLGYIFSSPIIQSAPPDLRRKLCRLVSNKSALAARIDSFHQNRDGSMGQQYVEIIKHYLEKLQEPPPVKQIKPLAAPSEGPRKRRGGRKYRKMKERFGLTEMRKQANRMTFAHIEDDAYQEDLGFTLGNLANQSSGKIRIAQVDNKTQVKISKSLQKTLQKQQNWRLGGSGARLGPSFSSTFGVGGGKSTVRSHVSNLQPSTPSASSVVGIRSSTHNPISGTASSIAFTPLQGLEIVNPLAAEKTVDDASAKYFSQRSGFVHVNQNK